MAKASGKQQTSKSGKPAANTAPQPPLTKEEALKKLAKEDPKRAAELIRQMMKSL